MQLKQQISKLVPLAIIVVGLLGYNFLLAQWQSPTATAPNNNTEAPINVSANYQAKLGDLGAVRMRAGQYCDEAGNNCFTGSAVISEINSTSSIQCTNTVTTVGGAGCFNTPSCPAGTVKVDTRQVSMAWCPGDGGDYTYVVDCLRTTCSQQ